MTKINGDTTIGKTRPCSKCHQPTRAKGYCSDCMADYHRLRNYGITPEQFAQLLNGQGGACGLCYRPFGPEVAPHVDHDHKSNIVRGLLCSPCNTGLGKLGDDVHGLLRAAQWVARTV